jgi:hypothetical protein
LANVLINDEINFEDASAYVEELIDNQVLVSNLEPTVTGLELQFSLLEKIEDLSTEERIKNVLNDTINNLEKLDSTSIGNGIDLYSEITQKVKEIDLEIDEKYLLQTDLILATEENAIDQRLVADLGNALSVINKLTTAQNVTALTKFRDAFIERYDEREIPLALALDNEVGIGFIQNNSAIPNDHAPLVDDLIIPISKNGKNVVKLEWDKNQSFLIEKYVDAIRNNQTTIEITDDDVSQFDENWDDLPSTFSVITEIIHLNGEYKIIASGAGGSSAVNLLGRFAHADEKIHEYVKEIIRKEEILEPNLIHAEIVHLPESRVGNILARPIFRKYEIPFMAQSLVNEEFQILIQDLLISVRNGRIILRSKKLNKEVIPHLSCSHNFSGPNSLPIYQFLGNIQTSNIKRNGISFFTGSLFSEFEYIPRIVYKNVILAPATWIIKNKDLEEIIKLKKDDEILDCFFKIAEKKNLPEKVLLTDGDNRIFIDLSCIMSIKTLLSAVKQRSYFTLKEFLFSDTQGLVKDTNGKIFTNEVIFSFYKD